jgi:hypothetical protein
VRKWIILSGLLLVAVGLSIFTWKVVELDLPLVPDEPEGLWQVGLRITGEPTADAFSLRAAMPSPNPNQFVFGEHFSSGRLRLGVRDDDHVFQAIRERLSPQEVATMMMPSDDLFSTLSLHQLPVGLQSALRILLLMPLGALVLTLLRNVVGLPSYGTFMPMLIALALRGTGLGVGLLLVGMVLAIGVAGRLFVTKLRLLLVPRLSLLLSVVVASVTGLAMAGFQFDERNFYAGVIFPIVILTMLVEHIMFSFPEWILVVMGILVWIGGYTGYRVSDVLRFRRVVSTSSSCSGFANRATSA